MTEEEAREKLREKLSRPFFISGYGDAEFTMRHSLRKWVSEVIAMCLLDELPLYESSDLPETVTAYDLTDYCSSEGLMMVKEDGSHYFNSGYDYYTFIYARDIPTWMNEHISSIVFTGVRLH